MNKEPIEVFMQEIRERRQLLTSFFSEDMSDPELKQKLSVVVNDALPSVFESFRRNEAELYILKPLMQSAELSFRKLAAVMALIRDKELLPDKDVEELSSALITLNEKLFAAEVKLAGELSAAEERRETFIAKNGLVRLDRNRRRIVKMLRSRGYSVDIAADSEDFYNGITASFSEELPGLQLKIQYRITYFEISSGEWDFSAKLLIPDDSGIYIRKLQALAERLNSENKPDYEFDSGSPLWGISSVKIRFSVKKRSMSQDEMNGNLRLLKTGLSEIAEEYFRLLQDEFISGRSSRLNTCAEICNTDYYSEKNTR